MNYHNITHPDMNNGEGLRVVLWLSGCDHHCKECQNPQTWGGNSGILFDKSAKEELFRELDKDYISGVTLTGGDPLYEKNLDEVLGLVFEINRRYNNKQYICFKSNNKHNVLRKEMYEADLLLSHKTIWLYTGYTWEDIWGNNKSIDNYLNYMRESGYDKRQQIISGCDVLVDGRYVDSQRDTTLKWRGSKNQRVIDIKKSLQQNKISLYCD